MKQFATILLFVASAVTARAQVKISSLPGIAHPAAMLELEATNKGLLLPRLTNAKLSTVPADMLSKGLMVYNTDSNRVFVFNGTAWQAQANASAPAWQLGGNSGITPFQFLGNIDSVPLYFRTHNKLRMSIGATGNVGIGTGTPISAFDIFNYGGPDESDDFNIRSYNNTGGPALLLYRAKLNGQVPANLQNGDFLGILAFSGEVGSTTTSLSSIIANYTGNGTSALSSLSFRTSGSQGMLLNDKGWLTIGNSSQSAQATADIQGSLRYKFTVPTGNSLYAINTTDLVILVTEGIGPSTIALPSTPDLDGHFIIIKNNKSTAISLSAGTGALLCNGGGSACSTLGAARVIGLVAQSTGLSMNWIQVF
jgi:hypothetical protein